MTADDQTAETREELMAATYRVLAARGFAGLTTQRVADEADCSQSLVHYHYDTKEELVVAFLNWVRQNETDWLAELGEGTPTERVRRFVDVQLGIPNDAEHGRFNVAFLELQAAAARNDRYRRELSTFVATIHEALAAIIREGIEVGEFRDVDPDATARFLRYALHSAVAASLTLDEEDAKTETRAAAMTYINRVLVAEAN